MYKIKSKFYKDTGLKNIIELIKSAIKEDVGTGDVTSDLFIPNYRKSGAELIAKENSVIAGIELFKLVFYLIDKTVKIKFRINEGENVKKGQVIAIIHGKTRAILKSERLALNIIQRMSGIANSVHIMNSNLKNSGIKILDTRKTTPNFRIFEKIAVKIGGGTNHRFGLFDMILIKDNHIEANSGLENIINKLKKIRSKTNLKIELEVKNLNEFKYVLKNGKGFVDIVMLDNFLIEDIKKAVAMNKSKFKIELSGGVNLSNLNHYAKLKGVNYISSGALTHSVKSADISLNFIS